MNILFICTGNTCRSPMAEAILKNKGIKGISVRSAGIFAMDGQHASIQTQQVLDENSIEHNHVSKKLSVEDIEWATKIITMTMDHKRFILDTYPFASEKVFTLKEAANGHLGDTDVMDPFGGSIEVYRETYNELTKLIENLIMNDR
ncbi:low molecular weight protein arginine phosphatase [Heyndrickxia oleronia]|uniref:low molecular weight protein arginine phosphatase n=1 Tax=Heyndrickxia oleronia TaxID=38875 RepID=UPI0023519198|nr:low molecular weight protein arginine phosphatase [Heyndrickxia oleronia]